MGPVTPKHYNPRRMTRKDRAKQKKEIAKSRKLYKQGKYHTRAKLASFKSKPSPHITRAKRMYRVDKVTANRTLAKKTKCSVGALRKIVRKGQGAYYSSGSRPNQTAHSWAYARLGSAITGGPSSRIDLPTLEKGCHKTSKALKLARQFSRKNQ